MNAPKQGGAITAEEDSCQVVETRIAGMIVTETPQSLSLRRSWMSTTAIAGCMLTGAVMFGIPGCLLCYVLARHFDGGSINGKPLAMATFGEQLTVWSVAGVSTFVLLAGAIWIMFAGISDTVMGRKLLILNRSERDIAYGDRLIGTFADVSQVRLETAKTDEGEDCFSLYLDSMNGRWLPLKIHAIGDRAEMETLGRKVAEYIGVTFLRATSPA